MMAIVLALKNNGKMTASNLAQMLEVNIRTIYRDIDALSQMEVPLSALPGKEGGYEILEDYFLSPIDFTKDEILALSISKDLILQTEIPGFDPYIHTAFLKIENSISPEEKKKIKRITDRILFDMKFIDPEMDGKDYFPIIKQSFEENKCLCIGYYSVRTQSVQERYVYPYFLTFSDGVWYLRGSSGDKPFLWWFRLDRIKFIKLEDEVFTLPEEFKKETYIYSENIQKSDRQDSEPQICKVKMSRQLYETVKDDVLFKNCKSISNSENYIVEIFTDRYDSIFEFLFRNSKQAELIEPEALKEEYILKLKTIVNLMVKDSDLK